MKLLLQSRVPGVAAEAVRGGQQYVHELLLPLPAVALAGLRETGMDSLAAVQQLVELCSKALQQDCIRFITTKRQQQREEAMQQAPAGAADASNSSSSSKPGSASADVLDAAQVFKLLLDSVSLQQACGAAVTEELLNGVAVAARGCSHPEVQQLLQQRGTELLHVLLRYIQHNPRQQQQQGADRSSSSSSSGSGSAEDGAEADAAAAAVKAEEDYYMPRRCVACAQVFMDVCSMGRRGVGEREREKGLCGVGTPSSEVWTLSTGRVVCAAAGAWVAHAAATHFRFMPGCLAVGVRMSRRLQLWVHDRRESTTLSRCRRLLVLLLPCPKLKFLCR
jgi:hypothetical protein